MKKKSKGEEFWVGERENKRRRRWVCTKREGKKKPTGEPKGSLGLYRGVARRWGGAMLNMAPDKAADETISFQCYPPHLPYYIPTGPVYSSRLKSQPDFSFLSAPFLPSNLNASFSFSPTSHWVQDLISLFLTSNLSCFLSLYYIIFLRAISSLESIPPFCLSRPLFRCSNLAIHWSFIMNDVDRLEA